MTVDAHRAFDYDTALVEDIERLAEIEITESGAFICA